MCREVTGKEVVSVVVKHGCGHFDERYISNE